MAAELYDVEKELERVLSEIITVLEAQDPFRLEPVKPRGPGVYAIYYTGDLGWYDEIRSPDATVPIYVGSSVLLSRRLPIHCRSLDDAWNLDRKDFLCRYLLLPRNVPLWVEQAYIAQKDPWWNRPEFSGFGTEGGRGADGSASKWDILHTGRPAALKRRRSADAMVALEADIARRNLQRRDLVREMFGANGIAVLDATRAKNPAPAPALALAPAPAPAPAKRKPVPPSAKSDDDLVVDVFTMFGTSPR